MKKLILFLVLLLGVSLTSKSQTIGDKKLSEIKSNYIEIVGMAKLMSAKVTISVDYGQKKSSWKINATRILDDNNKPVVFNGMIDALNFFTKYGYKFVTAYTVGSGGNFVYHYLLEKKTSVIEKNSQ